MICQHLSLTYCIPLAKDQSSFYEIRSLAFCINLIGHLIGLLRIFGIWNILRILEYVDWRTSREKGGLLCTFLKIEKLALILEKKALIKPIFGLIFHLKYSLKSIWEKKLLYFSCGAFFSCVFDKMFTEVP